MGEHFSQRNEDLESSRLEDGHSSLAVLQL